MQAALQGFVVHGVVTNIDFLQAVLSHPDFQNGQVATHWVEQNMDSLMESRSLLLENQQQAVGLHTLAAALADLTMVHRPPSTVTSNEPDPYSPWKTASSFRIGAGNG
jgi:pyruvate carboxylase